MPRIPRIHFPGALYHVFSRGNNRQDVFLSKMNYQFFLKGIERLHSFLELKVHAFCLMPNHYHLLIEVGEIPLSTFMQRLLTSYTAYFNMIHERVGHLFQGRYRAVLCEKDSYLLELVRYIHLNPVGAGLTKTPMEWEWSGHQTYTGHKNVSWLHTETVLTYLSFLPTKARQRYIDFVNDGISNGHREDLYPKMDDPYLGSERYKEKLKESIRKIDESERRVTNKSSLTLKDIMRIVAQNSGVKDNLIRGKGREASLVKARQEFIRMALTHGLKTNEIAEFIDVSPSFVLRVFKKGCKVRQFDKLVQLVQD